MIKSPLIQIALKIIVTVAIIGAIFYLLISPKLTTLVKNQIELEQLGQDLQLADDKLGSLRTAEKNQIALQQTHEEVFDLLPEEPSASSFILDIESVSRQIGVTVDSLSVSELKTTKTVKTTGETDSDSKTTAEQKTAKAEKALIFSITLSSDYEKTQNFLKSLELLPRFNKVEVVNISNYRPTDNIMSFKAEGKIYYGR